MSNASRCARYYARRRALEAQLVTHAHDLRSENFRLKEHVNMLERQAEKLEAENRRLREALLRHGVQQ